MRLARAGYRPLSNLRSAAGPWEFVEDDEAKVEWDGLSQEKKDEWGFENDLMEYLRGLVDKLDGQIKRAKEKLLADQSGRLTLSKETQAQVDQMASQIKDLQEEANTLGESGEVEEKKLSPVSRPDYTYKYVIRLYLSLYLSAIGGRKYEEDGGGGGDQGEEGSA